MKPSLYPWFDMLVELFQVSVVVISHVGVIPKMRELLPAVQFVVFVVLVVSIGSDFEWLSCSWGTVCLLAIHWWFLGGLFCWLVVVSSFVGVA